VAVVGGGVELDAEPALSTAIVSAMSTSYLLSIARMSYVIHL
jgi:hypothetical protein